MSPTAVDSRFASPTGITLFELFETSKEKTIAQQNKLMDEIAYKFQQNGYIIPKVIYWNADSRQDTYHAISENKNVAIVSGQSASAFRTVLMAVDEDPYNTMVKTLEDPMYDIVRI